MILSKLKKSLVITLSAIMLWIPNAHLVSAVENNTLNESINDEIQGADQEFIKDELKELEDRYGGEMIFGESVSKDFDENQIVLNFDSVEEFEALLKNFQEQSSIIENQNTKIEEQMSTYATGFKTIKHSAGDWGHLYWRSMDFNYETKVVNGKTQLERVYNRRSYPQGLTIAFWKEKWHSAPVYNSARTSVSMKVDGEWRLAVSINGLPVGYIQPAVWNFTYSL